MIMEAVNGMVTVTGMGYGCRNDLLLGRKRKRTI